MPSEHGLLGATLGLFEVLQFSGKLDRHGPGFHGACKLGSNFCPHLTWETLGMFAESQQGIFLRLSPIVYQEETRETELRTGHAGGGGVRMFGCHDV